MIAAGTRNVMLPSVLHVSKCMWLKLVTVAARSKAYVCGLSPAEIVGLNPTGVMDIRLFCRSQWPHGLRRRSAAARLLRSWVWIPPSGMDVCPLWVSCVLSGRGLCDELITSPKESYRLCSFVMCDLETSWMRRPWPTGGCCAKNKQTNHGKYRSQWLRGLRHRSAVALVPPGAKMSVCCECYMLSGRGLCDELITCPEEPYRLWCVVVCDLETSSMWRPRSTGGCRAKKKKN